MGLVDIVEKEIKMAGSIDERSGYIIGQSPAT